MIGAAKNCFLLSLIHISAHYYKQNFTFYIYLLNDVCGL